jgi:hypothetical protein
MQTIAKRTNRLTKELLETARDMRASGVMDTAAYEKITMRHLGDTASDGARTRSARACTGAPRAG